jgi:hypothetical protein
MRRKWIRSGDIVFAAAIGAMGMASWLGGYAARGSEDERRQWSVANDKEWESLLREGGCAKNGVMLEARPLAASNTAGGPVSIVLSVKNVGEGEVRVAFYCPRTPVAVIRDSAGRPVDRTTKGSELYSPRMSWSIRGVYLGPGDAAGMVFRLDEYFDLSKPDRYTVLATEYFGGDAKGQLTARPLVLDIRPAPETGKSRDHDDTPAVKPAKTIEGRDRGN